MKIFKLKHKPTGMFYVPSRGRGNLSRGGKLYDRKPRLEWTETIRVVLRIWSNRKPNKNQQKLIDYFGIKQDGNGGYWTDQYFKTNKEDWEIIEL